MKYRSVEDYLLDWPDGVSGGKGDGTAKQQLQLQNQLTQQQLDRQNALQDQIKSAFGSDLSGTNGFSPALMAALQSQFQNQTTQQFGQANQSVLDSLKAKGYNGTLPVGGDYARSLSSLEGAKANTLSSGTLNLGIANLQQAIQNKFNAGSLLNGQAAQLGSNVGQFNAGAGNALNTYVQAANQGFGAAFTKAFGGALGAGTAGLLTGQSAQNTLTRIPGIG